MSSYSYERIDRTRRRQQYGGPSTRRTALGYWVPLVVTVTVATIGLAAWIWSERRDGEDDDYEGRDDERPPPAYGGVGPGETSYGRDPGVQTTENVEENTMFARMSGALRRTPSPQQFFDGASRRVAAGVAAAGAAVGGALSSIREEGRDDYGDHSRWSEEVQTRRDYTTGQSLAQAGPDAITGAGLRGPGVSTQGRKKTVAVVVSADAGLHDWCQEDVYQLQHASVLAHLPEHIDPNMARVFILIYAPELRQHPLASSPSGKLAASITSSYSNIGQEDLRSPGEESERILAAVEPTPMSPSVAGATPLFNALYSQSQALVEKETMIMPFSTASGVVHLLRHIGPEVVYIQESLSGEDGAAVKHLSGWVGQVVVIVGAEGAHGGLVDSEDEGAAAGERWWQTSYSVGLGKGVEIVDAMRVGEDWSKRVGGHD